MTHKIEKNVPLPPARTTAGQSWGLPAVLRKMSVGDSILTDRKKGAALKAATKLGIKVTCRDDGNKLRVWRTA